MDSDEAGAQIALNNLLDEKMSANFLKCVKKEKKKNLYTVAKTFLGLKNV